MKVIADFCIVPMGVGVSVSKYVRQCVEILHRADIQSATHAHGTNVEGDWDEVMSALKACHEALHQEGVPRISTTVKLGTRVDKEQTMKEKIQKATGGCDM